MGDEDPRRKTIETGITTLALMTRSIAKLALTWTQDAGYSDQFDDRGKLVFLSMMSYSIAGTLSKQSECKEIAHIWRELMMALSDVADGKSADLFRPLKEVGAQPRRISVYREMYFSIAAAVYDLAKAGAKENVAKEIARKLKVKPSQLKDFRGNLTRGNRNIKSAKAIELYDSVSRGHLCVDENGQLRPGVGKPSSVANWLKWFDQISFFEV